MTIARARQVCLEATPYYHCVSRCVRRAFLCGRDRFTGRSFGHRRGWIEKRLGFLASVFAMDLCAYAVMSNHYHVVVRINRAQALAWSDDEVMERWLRLYRGSGLIQRYRSGAACCEAELKAVAELVALWRGRLLDLGWFMRNLNEPLARAANAEDGCKGRFWEGRYKCQALLDEKALLTCMAYVDLNPIRAALAERLEDSDHTSVQARLQGRDSHLARFQYTGSPEVPAVVPPIPCSQADYLELVDWTGRAVRTGKPGYIPPSSPAILTRFRVPIRPWLTEIKHYASWYGRAVGTIARAQVYCAATGTRWVQGLTKRSQSQIAAPA